MACCIGKTGVVATFLRTRSAGEGSGEKHWAWVKHDTQSKPDTPTTAQIEQDLIDALRARAADGLPQ